MKGSNNIISRLKKTWRSYKHNAGFVEADFGCDFRNDNDRSSITTWHYRTSLRAGSDKNGDQHCRYCARKSKGCGCYDDLQVWWEACQLAALVVPSSGSVERVFSLVSSLFANKQDKLLSDAIKLSLYLAFNKRKV